MAVRVSVNAALRREGSQKQRFYYVHFVLDLQALKKVNHCVSMDWFL